MGGGQRGPRPPGSVHWASRSRGLVVSSKNSIWLGVASAPPWLPQLGLAVSHSRVSMGKDEGPHYVLKQRGNAHALTHRAQGAPGVLLGLSGTGSR